jgi:hypothetical protein
MKLLFAVGLALAASPPADAGEPPAALGTREAEAATLPPVLPLRARARLQDQWLARRLDTVVPALMRAEGVDAWVMITREYVEDPVVATMLDAESMHARRRTILLFLGPGGGRPVERLTVSRYGMGGLFAHAWEPDKEPDQWKRLGALLAERNPKRIAINSSVASQFGDGLTLSQYEGLMGALTPALRERVVRTDALAIGWLETRIPEEMAFYPRIVRTAHAIIAEALSDKVIVPGKTTADDVVWWMRERVSALGLDVWFQPSIGILRRGAAGMLEGDQIIQRGDMLWTDFGITYLGLNTDTPASRLRAETGGNGRAGGAEARPACRQPSAGRADLVLCPRAQRQPDLNCSRGACVKCDGAAG